MLTDERYAAKPRAQVFYRKHGFVADAAVRVEDGVREVRMVRGMQR